MNIVKTFFCIILLSLCGCNSINFGLTAKDEGQNYRTIYVLGFAVLKEKTDINKVASVNDDNVLGLFYNTEQQKYGLGYYSGVYTKILKADDNIVLEIKRNILGKLEINSYILQNKEEFNSFEDFENKSKLSKLIK